MRMSLLVLPLLCALAVLTGCGTDESTIVIVNSDCGLVRADMTGTWQVQFDSQGSANVSGCDNPPPANSVGVSLNVKSYAVSVVGSDESTSWAIAGDRSDANDDPLVDFELIASVEADSCLAMFRIWEADDTAYIQCIGSLDLDTRTINGGCDSVEFDPDVDGVDVTDAICDLNAPGFGVEVDIL